MVTINDNGESGDETAALAKKRRRVFIGVGVVVVLVISFLISRCGTEPSHPGGSAPVTPPTASSIPAESPDESGTETEEPEESEAETTSAPLPGENRAIVKDPNGKTVWDRYRPNRQPVAPGITGFGGWGNVFWPTQKKPKEIIAPDPEPSYIRLTVNAPNNRENKTLTKQGYSSMIELLNINTRNYASLECGMSATNNGTGQFVRNMGRQCKNNREPSFTWEEMQNRGIILYVSRIEDWTEGQYQGFYDTPTNAFRGYKITLSASDQQGNKMYSVPPEKYLAYTTFSPANGRYMIDSLKLVKDQ